MTHFSNGRKTESLSSHSKVSIRLLNQSFWMWFSSSRGHLWRPRRWWWGCTEEPCPPYCLPGRRWPLNPDPLGTALGDSREFARLTGRRCARCPFWGRRYRPPVQSGFPCLWRGKAREELLSGFNLWHRRGQLPRAASSLTTVWYCACGNVGLLSLASPTITLSSTGLAIALPSGRSTTILIRNWQNRKTTKGWNGHLHAADGYVYELLLRTSAPVVKPADKTTLCTVWLMMCHYLLDGTIAYIVNQVINHLLS